ncbi:hypothetical protein DdX_13996 [Ditylenchus destructor]|uniref:Uncharacterized protein n=1 Tax=Ditylenchus destructor TaxID=166010 RepID=A0AAD4R284_9BILA|nr:hypothetical protein DdX_13996 [Ditylenchus destructor]
MTIHAATYLYLSLRSAKVPISLGKVYTWLGNFANTAYYTLGMSVFFLALDRCLAIHLAHNFTPRIKSVLLSVHLICNPGILIIGFFVDFTRNVGGLPGYRPVGGESQTSGTTISDTVVRNTTILDVCLEFIPSIPVYIMDQLDIRTRIVEFIWYPSLPFLTQCLNVAICGIIYNKTLVRQSKKIAVASVTTTNNSSSLTVSRKTQNQR